MKRRRFRSRVARRRCDPGYRARQLALLCDEVEAESRALIEIINLVIRELRSWK